MVKFQGLDELQSKLRRNANIGDVKRVVSTNGAEMANNAQRLAPVDTGRLAGSINLTMEDGGMTATVRDGVHYGVYNELGTRFMSAQPFMTPSFHLQVEKFKRDMEMLVK